MATYNSTEPQYHPVADRVLYVGNVPMDTTEAELAACFDICLRGNSLSFLQYPYDAEAKCHKGFAFVLLNRSKDVATCLSKRNRSDFYVEGSPSQGGFNSVGRAYLRIRSAHIEECNRKEDATHLIFTPESESAESTSSSVGLRDFKVLIEEIIRSMGVDIVKSEGELDGRKKYVHIHTRDAESAAVVKMFVNNFKENDVVVKVRYARMPKVAKATAVLPSAQEPVTKESSFVLEPITENYGRFGIPYSEVVKTSPVKVASVNKEYSTLVSSKVAPIGHAVPAKGKAMASKPASKSHRLAGTA